MHLHSSLSHWSSLVLVGHFAFWIHARSHICYTKRNKNSVRWKEASSLGFYVPIAASAHVDTSFLSFKLHKQKRWGFDGDIKFPSCLEHVVFSLWVFTRLAGWKRQSRRNINLCFCFMAHKMATGVHTALLWQTELNASCWDGASY